MIRKIGIIGFGKTGKAVLNFLLKSDEVKDIVIYDDMFDGKIDPGIEKPSKNIEIIRDKNSINKLKMLDKVIISPGVNGRDEKFSNLRNSGVEIVSEIEFAAGFVNCPIVAVTGSNGKSTTVSLIHHFLKSSGKNSHLAGNIGIPFISVADKTKEDNIVVLEVSSFQLEEIKKFRPFISVILNITPDHLDRYSDFNDYMEAKLSIVSNQKKGDFTVLNSRDKILKNYFNNRADDGGVEKIWFPEKSAIADKSAFLKDSRIRVVLSGKIADISLKNNPLLGDHNIDNIMAASIVSLLLGVKAEQIENSLGKFRGLAHRMEKAGRLGPVVFVNDSKATNIDATLKAITGTEDNIVIILGGKDKGGDFSVFESFIGERVKKVLLIGDAAEKISDQLRRKRDYLVNIGSLKEGIRLGYETLKNSGGTVLLSPGCASYDMFSNFEERGNEFKKEVAKFTGSEKNG